jgi:hypothetical protein
MLELCGAATSGKSHVGLAAAVACVLSDASSTALCIVTTLDCFAVRARALAASTVAARVGAWRRGVVGSRGSLAARLPHCAARRASQGLEAEAALASDLLNERDVVGEEVGCACEALRIVTALDWPRLQKLLSALERDALALPAASAEPPPRPHPRPSSSHPCASWSLTACPR